MLRNMLNDLAEAIRRWTEKKCFRWRNASLAGGFAGRRVWLAAVFFCVLF